MLRIEADVTEEEEKALYAWYYGCGVGTMVVHDDDSRAEKLKEYIDDSYWTFSSDFLASYTGLPIKLFDSLSTLSEGGNDAVKELVLTVGSEDDFIAEVVSQDGYGHFLASYDGDEIEVRVCGRDFYAYRED